MERCNCWMCEKPLGKDKAAVRATVEQPHQWVTVCHRCLDLAEKWFDENGVQHGMEATIAQVRTEYQRRMVA